MKIVDPVFAKLYAVLEKKFTLQQSAKAVGDLIAQFAEDADYKKYVSPISYVALSQVMRKVSQVYSAVNFETLLALFGTSCAFAFKRHEIENFIIKSCARGELQAYIDHVTDSVCFKAKLSSVGGGVGQLGVLGAKLFAITNSISRGGREKQHSKPQSFIDLIEAERRENLARKFKIDQKKELLEQLAVEREKALAKERALRAQEEAEAEKIRLTEEANRREAERRKREKEEIDRRQMLKLAEEMKKKNLKLEIEASHIISYLSVILIIWVVNGGSGQGETETYSD